MSQPLLLKELRETVFEYMDPSFRFHLSLHLPSLRSVEKRAHLKINKLILNDNEITVNKTTYKLSIDRKYEIEKPPLRRNGPVDHDVDEFGFKTFTKDIIMNGDVRMENHGNYDVNTLRRMSLRDEESVPMKTLEKKGIPKSKSTLKLTITSGNGEPWIYTCSKITKIYEGMKMLIATMFGNRTVIWDVDFMIISTKNLRWIVSGVKPFVRKMKLGCYRFANLDGLRSICHETSFPLNWLCFEASDIILGHEILVNAEYLVVGSQLYNYDSMDLLMKISNLKVRLPPISLNTFAHLMDLWLEHGRPVGTNWSFRVKGSELSEYISTLREIAQAIESDRRFIKMPMSPSSILSVSYDDPILHGAINRQEMIWTVKMEVLQR
ncbi:Protein CBG11844 [Caenorhabditis briggsae]|uniref:Protein CBG11844 n=1 Tax=Caenorhabditis briggsae TaxID=6238 RepID=A8XE54_CAEBR|nr:Protein CBG11844 [Caenorhabditis briggsae]CAP30926.1 Protein CBG11844 [Caenorhabditis briggsae]